MPEFPVKAIAEFSAVLLEVVGVAVIVVQSLYALLYGVVRKVRGDAPGNLYHEIRQRLGRGILLGLEILVAADIIHTVAVDLTLRTVLVLGLIVLIRTFLSVTLELELTGKWPWQRDPANEQPDS